MVCTHARTTSDLVVGLNANAGDCEWLDLCRRPLYWIVLAIDGSVATSAPPWITSSECTSFMSFSSHSGKSVGIAIFIVMLLGVSVAQEPDRGARTMKILRERQEYQRTISQRLKAFHDFQFEDGYAPSQITFTNRVVDDAAKDWKPAHYDHGNAVAVADVDGDGRLDIYFTTQLGENQLWRNRGHGQFENVTAKAGVALSDSISVGAAFADIDNDGDPDLFVTTVRHGNHLFENLGGGKFRDVTVAAGLNYSGHSSAATFLDYDQDGLLDLLVCNVGIFTANEKGRDGFYRSLTNAFAGHLFPERTERSILYQNLGNHRFKEVTREMNLVSTGWNGEATTVDLNGDGYPDVYLTNMQGDNHYFENQKGKGFAEKTAQYFSKTPWGAMQAKFLDFNNDGLMDLSVVDMHSDMNDLQMKLAGNMNPKIEKAKSEAWCTTQYDETFLQNSSNNIFGNAFYVNLGDGKFEERSDALGTETYWPWGVTVGDFNADGYQDMFVGAGMGFPFRYAINSLLLNEEGKKFQDSEFLLGVEPRSSGEVEIDYFTLDCSGADKEHRLAQGKSGLVSFKGTVSTRSSVSFDLDDDGDLDLVTLEWNYHPQVLLSNLSAKKAVRYLKIKLVGTKSNRDGTGALVKVHAGGKTYTQYADGKSGYLAQSVMPFYFGLGEASQVETIEVLWPTGRKQTVTQGLELNRLLTIRETSD